MTYVRNPSGDLVYDQSTGNYSLAGYNVVSIKRTAFLKRGYVIPFINSVDMNDIPFVNNTMYGTFYSSGNAALTTVTNINDNTTNMVNTFYNCQNLTSIDKFPSNLINISGCFQLCKNLNYVPSIPNSVTCMDYTFADCTSLTSSPSIPSSVVSMRGTYSNASNLSSPPILPTNLLPDGLVDTFRNSGIVNVPTIPDSITTISNTFADCNELNPTTYINLSTKTNIINMDESFHNCKNLQYITRFPPYVESLYKTFANCTNLYYTLAFSVPNTVTNMCGTFYNCKKFYLFPYLSEGLETLGSCCGYGTGCFAYTNISSLTNIPSTVTDMSGCFTGCTELKNMPQIPWNVTNMNGCFSGCTHITSFNSISINANDISGCFEGCTNLVTAPVIPRNTFKIGFDNHGLFSDCINLTGNIYVTTPNITYANFVFANTSLPKNVYIPFKDSNNVNTPTYDAFIRAGYDTEGTKDGVTLIDLEDDCVFGIQVKQQNAIVTIKYNGIEIETVGSETLVLPKNTTVNYTIEAVGYLYQNHTIELENDIMLYIDLENELKSYTVTYDNARYMNHDTENGSLEVYSRSSDNSFAIANDFEIVENEG